jgi:hypothetical protein|tara:strand:+ start:1803 stop:2165 length:363 start_codon:yes stop_codon:yes gene_type:complete
LRREVRLTGCGFAAKTRHQGYGQDGNDSVILGWLIVFHDDLVRENFVWYHITQRFNKFLKGKERTLETKTVADNSIWGWRVRLATLPDRRKYLFYYDQGVRVLVGFALVRVFPVPNQAMV